MRLSQVIPFIPIISSILGSAKQTGESGVIPGKTTCRDQRTLCQVLSHPDFANAYTQVCKKQFHHCKLAESMCIFSESRTCSTVSRVRSLLALRQAVQPEHSPSTEARWHTAAPPGWSKHHSRLPKSKANPLSRNRFLMDAEQGKNAAGQESRAGGRMMWMAPSLLPWNQTPLAMPHAGIRADSPH